jgi:hypothetical protein
VFVGDRLLGGRHGARKVALLLIPGGQIPGGEWAISLSSVSTALLNPATWPGSSWRASSTPRLTIAAGAAVATPEAAACSNAARAAASSPPHSSDSSVPSRNAARTASLGLLAVRSRSRAALAADWPPRSAQDHPSS